MPHGAMAKNSPGTPRNTTLLIHGASAAPRPSGGTFQRWRREREAGKGKEGAGGRTPGGLLALWPGLRGATGLWGGGLAGLPLAAEAGAGRGGEGASVCLADARSGGRGPMGWTGTAHHKAEEREEGQGW